MWEWFEQHETVLWWVAGVSAGFFLLSLMLIPVLIVKMPADYFAREHRGGNVAWRIVRNVIGWPLIAAGVLMLVLPGQGVITILLGLSLVDFPGKHRAERWLLSRGKVLHAANWLRAKYRREPLRMKAGDV